MPLPPLLDAQVVKTVRRRRLVRVSHRVVFGALEAVHQVFAACGWQINTAFVERLNLSMRQQVAAYLTPVSVKRCRSLSRPMGWARPSHGGPVRQRCARG